MGVSWPDLGGRIIGALRASARAMCDDCLALKLSLSRHDVLATVRALEAEDPPPLLVHPGLCSLCQRTQRVMRVPADHVDTTGEGSA